MNIREWDRQGNIFNDHHAQVPVVDVCDRYWRIYYSYRINGKSVPYYIDVDPANPSKILRKSDKQLLQLGELGRFDWAGIMPTDIIDVGSQKYMYYIGWSVRKDVPYHNTLGLAISEDNGDTWYKFSDGPVFSTSYKEPGYVGTAEVVLVDNTYYMYYLSCRDWIVVDNHPEPVYDIKIALSKNAIDWEPLDRVAIGLEKGQGGVSKATVIQYENRYFMWYSARSESNYRLDSNYGYRIYCAVSDDLFNWIKLKEHGLDNNISSDWERIMVEYPDVFIDNNRLHMFYNGDGFGRTGIGYAHMDITSLKYTGR